MVDIARVTTSLENMFKHLPPAVAERVRAKYAEDREKFLEFVKATMPSNSPAYWAAAGCTSCFARGIIGDRVLATGSTPVSCACTGKKYEKWLREARAIFNAQKEQGNEQT